MHGNPWLRPHRRDVENLIATQSGDRYPRERKVRTTELAQVNRKLTQLRALAAFEEGGRRFWPNLSAMTIIKRDGPARLSDGLTGSSAARAGCPPYSCPALLNPERPGFLAR